MEETPIIRLKGMGKEFKTANGPVVALDDINLDIRKGEIFGIIGLSGAGKSTLVRCINMLEIPTSGEVVFEGQNLAALPEREQRKARQSMGMIFQQFNLLAQRNVVKNVCFPMEIAGFPRAKAQARAMELLKVFDLDHEHDYKASNLPYGKQRKLEIARALATDPKLLLLDEPAAGMNPNETAELMETIRFVRKEFDMTILLIEHDMKLVSGICEKLTVLNFGQVLTQGETSAVLNDKRVITAYLGE